MSEIELLRIAIVPLITTIVLVISGLLKFLWSQNQNKSKENNTLTQALNTERGDHQITKNNLTRVETQYEILQDSHDRLANTEEIYLKQIRSLSEEINQNKIDFDQRLSQMRKDFDAEIEKINNKHQEFIAQRDKEIQNKNDEIIRLEQLAERSKLEHEAQLQLKDEELQKKADKLDEFRGKLETLEGEYQTLKEQFDKLVKRLDTQELTLPDEKSPHGENASD